ncbi:MAG: HAD-IA family hydrolase [Pseudomonadota bacterium]
MKAFLFGSIGTIVETSELQRAAFNQAFADHGLDWAWSREDYREMLTVSGGKNRIARYAEARGDTVDATALHAAKSEIFQAQLADQGVIPREGTTALAQQARSQSLKLGFVTTTEPETVRIICQSLLRQDWPEFDVLTSREHGVPGKPDPAIYKIALNALAIAPHEAIAIEDNADGVAAAKAAGIHTVGFPGANTRAADLAADEIVDGDLFAALRPHLSGKLEPTQ